MSSFKEYKKSALMDPKVKAEYDAMQPEYDIIQTMIEARIKQDLTQKQLSERTGITQADISRIENGTLRHAFQLGHFSAEMDRPA